MMSKMRYKDVPIDSLPTMNDNSWVWYTKVL